MPKKLDFDLEDAHKYFSTYCFNKAWDLIDQPARTTEEDEEMNRLSLASFWHWTQRPDCTDKNLSISYWQIARIYAILGRADEARRYGLRCLEVSKREDVPQFYLGYAYEALARAEFVAGEREKHLDYLREARHVAESLQDRDAKQQLLADLDTID